MRIKYRYGFNNNEGDIADFIIKQNIKFDKGDIVTVFELFNDDENFKSVSIFLENHNIYPSISEAIFSQKEIDEAQWLRIRSTWRYAYPQPENRGYIFSTYDTSDYCDICRKGLIQKESFILKKEPNWGSRNFLMVNLINDELFISRKAEYVLKNNNLCGFSIYDVLNKSKNKMNNIKQIYVNSYLSSGLSKKSIFQEFVCTKCKHRKYILKPDFIYYDKQVFENIHEDIIKSNEKFGEIGCDNIIIITQKFFKVIKTNKLDRGLIFEPVKLI